MKHIAPYTVIISRSNGRLYCFLLQGSLTLVRFIEGFEKFTRFGHAMANLGDINGDGYDGKFLPKYLFANFIDAIITMK